VSLEDDLRQIWDTAQELYLSFADVVYRTDEGKSLQEEALELKEIVLRNGRKIR